MASGEMRLLSNSKPLCSPVTSKRSTGDLLTATHGVGNEQLKKAAKGYPGCLGYIKEIILITQLCYVGIIS